MKEQHIHIKGARMHNLKDVEVKIEHGKLTVITGLSGSGKSSLAFDTLYAEGQRRYIESLSAYARQFLGKLDKPEVDFIKGISPAVAIEQKVNSTNPRSTVGTITEIYDFLKILFARVGKTYSPVSGNEVKKHNVSDVLDAINALEKGTRALVLAPLLNIDKYGIDRQLNLLKDQGYVRVLFDGELHQVVDLIENPPKKVKEGYLVIDRIKSDKDSEENISRIGDSVQLAFAEGNGTCIIQLHDTKEELEFSNRFELDGMEFVEPTEHFFTFNNPFGACKTCEGFGTVIGIDESLVIPDKSLSVYEGAVLPWNSESMSKYLNALVMNAAKFDFPIHKPVEELTEEQYDLLWNGNKYFEGINDFFAFVESKSYKIQYRVLLARYRGKTKCTDCKGTRLRKDASYVKLGGKNIQEIVLDSVKYNLEFFRNLELGERYEMVTKRVLPEIVNRLELLSNLGLSYLTLNRQANTLSGGESQRINLANSLGSSLVGSMYILDEPSIGLHPKDTDKLIQVLKDLRDIGNTVIVVEHEEAMMENADSILDIGPMAGVHGGEVVFHGDHKALIAEERSLTAQYLTGKKVIPTPDYRRPTKDKLTLKKVYANNIKGMEVDFPLNNLVCVTGVSGSGKSSLVKDVLFPKMNEVLGIHRGEMKYSGILEGDTHRIHTVEFIDQNPIGKSSRSNPVTYVKAFDDIRDLFSKQQLSKIRGYKPGWFSFNVDGGRCEMCEGEGEITVSMQFMADVHLNCEACNGTRFKQETLEVEYKGYSIADILALDVESALELFKEGTTRTEEKIVEKLQPLFDVGLGYLSLGQASSTLSGGEAQRVKLASFLIKSRNPKPTLFIFDEPTTGLHFYDIEKLLIAFNALIGIGHSVIVIEHDMDVVKCADYVIDLGPEGGDKGGNLVFAGTPEDLAKCKDSHTGQFLKLKLEKEAKV
ncbi:excinuclease ABC subunit A [Lishizhenia tianjinensis]|uniref:UvrABC system protein A n=1 Tax=Lishizhenia tianjinensis TaxID=477690 RepID=A0A1I6YGD5_9FLAO|nr:excinuclease ABC subunit UvrA [Lishizhenia tianjinensis]SFT49430.1 excinuclease ABC subunit A [Lishizhenia tianjinensis]